MAPPGLTANESEFEFEAEPHPAGELRVLSFEAFEALSTPYRVTVELAAPADVEVDSAKLVGAPAQLTLRAAGESDRCFHGEICAVKTADVAVSAQRARLKVTLRPRLWRLAQVHRSRIFQGKSAKDVVEAILKDAKVEHRFDLSGSPAAREFCVQYRETDLAFVSRLLEEEGIFYFFEQAQGAHTLVLVDSSSACPELAGGEPRLPWREASGRAADEESIFQLATLWKQTSSAISLRDFNYLRPAQDLTAGAKEDADEPFERYDYPARYENLEAGKARAKVQLEEVRAQGERASAHTTSRRVSAGVTFALEEHPDAAFNRDYLVLAAHHTGEQREAVAGEENDSERGYACELHLQPKEIPYRPPRLTPRPVVKGAQTARVGSSGDEIHTDAHGRIKVQFHWDRDGKKDDRSSVWLRVAQPWAGGGMGATFLPRQGHEVLVRFLEGDPDRPLVVGSVYNGEHAPPVELPAEKTRSTLRTSSSPGDSGFNELRFEDAAGEEEIFHHAQHDSRTRVLNDASQEVGGNEQLGVGKDRTREVHGSQTGFVGAEDQRAVHGKQTVDVTGNRTAEVNKGELLTVAKDRTATVGGNRHLTVGSTTMETVDSAGTLTVGAAYGIAVASALSVEAGGAASLAVGGIYSVDVGGSFDVGCEKAGEIKVGGDNALEVGGAYALDVAQDSDEKHDAKLEIESVKETGWMAKKIELSATDELQLVVGGNLILKLAKNGDVKLSGKKISVDADSDLKLKGSEIKKTGDGSLGSGSAKVKKLEGSKGSRSAVSVKLKNQDGEAMSNVRYRVELPDGSAVEGKLDGGGGASVASSKEGNAKVSFPDLDGSAWKDS